MRSVILDAMKFEFIIRLNAFVQCSISLVGDTVSQERIISYSCMRILL